MQIKYWDKSKLMHLSSKEKDDWFDVYNNHLELNKGFNFDEMNQTDLNKSMDTIKKDYLTYLESLIKDKNFLIYLVLYDDDKIVSLCRLILRNEVVYIAGLETHRDYRQLGYAKKVILESLTYIFNENINAIHSVVRKWNTFSIKAHLSLEFNITEDKGDSLVLSLGNIKRLVKPIIEEFIGSKIDKIDLLSEKIVLLDNQYNFDLVFDNKRYVAKFHSSNKHILNKIIKNINLHNENYIESKKYGYTHKYHLYGKEYWLWIETYK